MALAVGITSEDKRSTDLPQAQARRIQAGPVHLSPNHYVRRRGRPSLQTPPYAVQMEPLVQYSQRDPLYHQRQDLVNLTKDNSIEDKVTTGISTLIFSNFLELIKGLYLTLYLPK